MSVNNVLLVDLNLVNQCIAEHLHALSKEHEELKELREESKTLERNLVAAKEGLDKIVALQEAFNRTPSSATFSALVKNNILSGTKSELFPKEYDDYLKQAAEYEVCRSHIENRIEQLKKGHENSDVDKLYYEIEQEIEAYQKSRSWRYVYDTILKGREPVLDYDKMPIGYVTLSLMERIKAVAFFKARLRSALEKYLVEKLPIRTAGQESWLSSLDSLLFFANSPDAVIVPGADGYSIYETLLIAIESNGKKEGKVKSKLKELFNFVVMQVPRLETLEELMDGIDRVLSHDLSCQIREAAKAYFDFDLNWMGSRFNVIWEETQTTCDQKSVVTIIKQEASYQELEVIYNQFFTEIDRKMTGHEKNILKKQIEDRFVKKEALILIECLEQGYSLQVLGLNQYAQVKAAKELLQKMCNYSQTASQQIQLAADFWNRWTDSKKGDDLAWMIHGLASRYQLDDLREIARDDLTDIKVKQATLEPLQIRRDGFVRTINCKIEREKKDRGNSITLLDKKLQDRKGEYQARMKKLQSKEKEMLERLKKQVASIFKQYEKKEGVGLFERFYYGKVGRVFAKNLSDRINHATSYAGACEILQDYFSRVKEVQGFVKLRDHSFAIRLLMALFGDGGVFNKDIYLSVECREVAEKIKTGARNEIVAGLQQASTERYGFFQDPINSVRASIAQEAAKMAQTQAAYFDTISSVNSAL